LPRKKNGKADELAKKAAKCEPLPPQCVFWDHDHAFHQSKQTILEHNQRHR
jgi:hypothetical protein